MILNISNFQENFFLDTHKYSFTDYEWWGNYDYSILDKCKNVLLKIFYVFSNLLLHCWGAMSVSGPSMGQGGVSVLTP